MKEDHSVNRYRNGKLFTASKTVSATVGLGRLVVARTVSDHVRLVTMLAQRGLAVADIQNRKSTAQPAPRFEKLKKTVLRYADWLPFYEK